MPERRQETIRVAAPVERCYEVVADLERYPEWQKDVKAVRIIDTDDEGRVLSAEITVSGLGRTVRQTLRYDHAGAPDHITWSLVEGDMVKMLTGAYEFSADDGGTKVVYTLEVELSMPVPGLLKRKVQGMIMGGAVRDFARRVESGD